MGTFFLVSICSLLSETPPLRNTMAAGRSGFFCRVLSVFVAFGIRARGLARVVFAPRLGGGWRACSGLRRVVLFLLVSRFWGWLV